MTPCRSRSGPESFLDPGNTLDPLAGGSNGHHRGSSRNARVTSEEHQQPNKKRCENYMTGAELIAAAKLIQEAYAFSQSVDKLINPDPTTIRELYFRLGQVEIEIAEFSRLLENITYEARRAEVIEIVRAVDGQRALSAAALQYSVDHPGDTSSEIPALSAAIALSSDSYYTFPGRTAGSPDRFDPRITLPSFLNAVSTWLALRQLNASPWTDNARNSLARLADALDSCIRRIEANVTCVERWSSFDRIADTGGSGLGREHEDLPTFESCCSQVITCIDHMAESGQVLFSELTVGSYCNPGSGPEDIENFNDEGKRGYLTEHYMPGRLREIADVWRTHTTR
jgi:hypothetical protein